MKDLTGEQTPLVTAMRVIPVAGHDSMLLNLSGAHGPLFTRNVVVLTDNAGHTGVGEVPGGEKIRRVLEQSMSLVVGQPLGDYNAAMDAVRLRFAEHDVGGRGLQTYDFADHGAYGDCDRVRVVRPAGPVSGSASCGIVG